ncbi:MAG: GAP family protein [Bdellovibrionota bacterium]
MISAYLSAFAAGLVSSFSPCVYPMIPITLGFLGLESKDKRASKRVLLFAFGQILAFVGLGLFTVMMGEIFGFTSQNPWILLATGIIILLFGFISISSKMPGALRNWNQWTHQKAKDLHQLGDSGAILLGAFSALVASPCTTPALGAVLLTMAQETERIHGIIMMVMYSLGFTLLFILLGSGLVAIQKLPRAGQWMKRIHQATTILIFAVAGYYFYQAYEAFTYS